MWCDTFERFVLLHDMPKNADVVVISWRVQPEGVWPIVVHTATRAGGILYNHHTGTGAMQRDLTQPGPDTQQHK